MLLKFVAGFDLKTEKKSQTKSCFNIMELRCRGWRVDFDKEDEVVEPNNTDYMQDLLYNSLDGEQNKEQQMLQRRQKG